MIAIIFTFASGFIFGYFIRTLESLGVPTVVIIIMAIALLYGNILAFTEE